MKQKEDYFEELTNKYLKQIEKAIEIDYSLGSAISITNSKISGKETNMNPLSLNAKQKEANIEIMSSLIRGVNTEMSKKINYLINENIANNGSINDLAKTLKTLFEEDNPNYFNYKNRFKTIARTESTRIMAQGSKNTAMRLGANKKWVSVVQDHRTSCICGELHKKYGNSENAIDANKPFTAICDGKSISEMQEPFHQNCRTITIYLF